MSKAIDSIAYGTANLIWLIFGGLLLALSYFFEGLLFCITIIGIPFGIQLFKIGLYILHPFGYSIEDGDGIGSGCLGLIFNVIWILIGGIWLALAHLLIGLLFCITVIGIPIGVKHLQTAWLALVPFGKVIEKDY